MARTKFAHCLTIILCEKLKVMMSDFIVCPPFPLPIQLSIECLLTKLLAVVL